MVDFNSNYYYSPKPSYQPGTVPSPTTGQTSEPSPTPCVVTQQTPSASAKLTPTMTYAPKTQAPPSASATDAAPSASPETPPAATVSADPNVTVVKAPPPAQLSPKNNTTADIIKKYHLEIKELTDPDEAYKQVKRIEGIYDDIKAKISEIETKIAAIEQEIRELPKTTVKLPGGGELPIDDAVQIEAKRREIQSLEEEKSKLETEVLPIVENVFGKAVKIYRKAQYN